ncbi:MAG: DUF6448 family protein [Terriglobia bacterium]
MQKGIRWTRIGLTALVVTALIWLPSLAWAHCDTLEGPVVKAAKLALERGDVTPVLKWVKAQHEPEIREAFAQTLKVRATGSEARALADRFFFETLVRLHREGEGAPYTGLKPPGTKPEPAVLAADQALEHGSVDALVKLLADEVAAGVRKRFAHAAVAKKGADNTIDAGREFVAAYVEFVHYAEGVHSAATGLATSHEPAAPSEAQAVHTH